MSTPDPAAPGARGTDVDSLRRAAAGRAAARDWAGAAALLDEAAVREPGDAATWYALAKALENGGQPRRSHAAAMAAQAAGPAKWSHALALARMLRGWRETQALRALSVAMRAWQHEAPVRDLVELADLLSREDLHDDALAWTEQALVRAPDDPAALYMRGTKHLHFGRMAAARADLERAIAVAPHFAQAHWRLSELRDGDRAAAAARVARMRAQQAQAVPGSEHDIHFSFALHDELHDLGEHAAAWAELERGCRAKRATLRYDAAADRALLASIPATCDARYLAGPGHAGADDEPTPLFIVGLFRSGTTLLERLLGAHPDIADTGESGGFFARLRLAADHPGGLNPALLDAAARADAAALGADFMATQRWRAHGRRVWTEKLPANVLLAGFIARALPRARFVHMRRPPMDVCFSNLRKLYGNICPYSYDQREMAGYHAAYTGLTDHWRAVLGDRWLDVDHADLVAAPEATLRRVLAHCGLPYDPAVLAPGDRGGAVSTASAAQVRDGVREVGTPAWWPYRAQLGPLAAGLGIDLGG